MRTLLMLACLAAAAARAETYDSWLRAGGVETGAITVAYAAWPGFAGERVSQPAANTHGGYEGDLLLLSAPDAQLALPLRIKIVFAGVRTEERAVPGGSHALAGDEWKRWLVPSSNSWSQVALQGRSEPPASPVRPETLVRETVAGVEILVPALSNGAARVPFGIVSGMQGWWFARDCVNCLAARYEVTDARGRILARGIVPQLLPVGFGINHSAAWVTGDEEADRLLRERRGLSAEETVCPLPPEDAAYEETRAIWVSQSAWENTPGGAGFWQRRLLQGVSIFGRPATIQQMQHVLDPATNGVLLAAQLKGLTAGAGVPRAAGAAPAVWDGGGGGLDLQFGTGNRYEESTLENVQPLFTRLSWYAGWTVLVLGIFTFGTVVALALAFVRLRGSRRTLLWWALPVWALAFAAFGGGVGRLVLPHRPRVDVTEYRYAHIGWPEMYCRADGRMLRFDERACQWRLPAGAMDLPPATMLYARPARRGTPHVVRTPEAVEYTLTGCRAGASSQICASWFRPCNLPFEITGSGEARCLRARTDLARVLVWSRGGWHDCGAVAAGREARVDSGKGMDRVPGLPLKLAACWSKGCQQMYIPRDVQDCSDSGEVVRPAPAAMDTWLVVALQRVPPDLRAADERSEATGRVVWVVQCP
jgi:hypothetical protein